MLVLCLFAMTSCADNPAGPAPRLNERFTLAPGMTAAVAETDLRVQFREVTGDSRCPADAVCIQGGDALVHVRASSSAATTDYELHTGDASRGVAMHGPFRILLTELTPYPFSASTIAKGDYRASFEVTRP